MPNVPFTVWLYAAALIGSVPLVWFSVAGDSRGKRTRDALSTSILPASFREVSLARPARERFADSFVGNIGRFVRRYTPSGITEETGRRLSRAGLRHRFTPDRFFTVKALMGFSTFLIFFLVALSSASIWKLLAAIVLGGVAFMFPDLLVIRRADNRQSRIRNQLPDIIDQVLIAVEAGLSFDSAVDRIARRGNGPLESELRRVMQDIALGMSRKDALLALTERSDVPELRELIFALAQSEEHGLPVGRVLRVQADEIRDKRRNRAEETALKVPVKIVFPLILCILPCLMAIIIGPAVVRISQNLNF